MHADAARQEPTMICRPVWELVDAAPAASAAPVLEAVATDAQKREEAANLVEFPDMTSPWTWIVMTLVAAIVVFACWLWPLGTAPQLTPSTPATVKRPAAAGKSMADAKPARGQGPRQPIALAFDRSGGMVSPEPQQDILLPGDTHGGTAGNTVVHGERQPGAPRSL